MNIEGYIFVLDPDSPNDFHSSLPGLLLFCLELELYFILFSIQTMRSASQPSSNFKLQNSIS